MDSERPFQVLFLVLQDSDAVTAVLGGEVHASCQDDSLVVASDYSEVSVDGNVEESEIQASDIAVARRSFR